MLRNPIFLFLLLPHLLLAQLPQVKEGDDVVVTLCSVSQVTGGGLAHEEGRAEFGLSFVFLIEKKTAEEGRFALKELADFALADASYSALSKSETRSSTVVSDFDEYSDKLELWKIGRPKNKALFMTTKILGDRVELSGDLQVAPTFSWGTGMSPQAFSFSIPVSEIQQ